jgi:hypothetical protein
MTLEEFMSGKTPSASFEGFSTADDMVLAVDFSGSAADPNTYTVAQTGIREQSSTLTAQTQTAQYLRTGEVVTKTGTSRSFNVTGDRFNLDPFQDALLAYDLKFGIGQAVIKAYVYFNMLTGVGEKGKVSIAVSDDYSGAAGENAGFSATLTSTEKPIPYAYVASDTNSSAVPVV